MIKEDLQSSQSSAYTEQPAVEQLSESLKRHEKIIQSYKTQNIFVEESNIKSLVQHIKRRTALESIFTTNYLLYSFTKEDFATFFEVLRLSSASLRSINLGVRFAGGQFRKLFGELARCQHLKSLRFDFSHNWGFGHSEMQQISLLLRSIHALSVLDLGFSFYHAMDLKDFQALCFGLKCQNRLSDLRLNFYRCHKITPREIDNLIYTFEVLSSLKRLRLDFTQCGNVGDVGAATIAKALRSLKALTSLTLKLQSTRIGTKGLEEISFVLKELTHLEEIDLNFFECGRIQDKAFESLCKSLEGLNDLKSLSLNFYTCKQITDKSLEKLSASISLLKNLETLNLKFADSEKMSVEGVQGLARALKEHQKLSKINILLRLPNVSQENFENIFNEFMTIQKVREGFLIQK